MKKAIILILITLSFSCISFNSQTKEFNSGTAYVGIYLDNSYILSLKDLDTEKVTEYKLKKKNGLTICVVPPGCYAVQSIELKEGLIGKKLDMHVPLYLKTIINIEEDSMVFLGNLDIKKKLGLNSVTYYMNYDYTWDEAIAEIETEYYYSKSFNVQALEKLSIENISVSHFDFSL